MIIKTTVCLAPPPPKKKDPTLPGCVDGGLLQECLVVEQLCCYGPAGIQKTKYNKYRGWWLPLQK